MVHLLRRVALCSVRVLEVVKVIHQQAILLGWYQCLTWDHPLKVIDAFATAAFEDVLLQEWFLQVPDADSVFSNISGYAWYHKVFVWYPFSFLNIVLSLDSYHKVCFGVRAEVPDFDGLVLPSTKNNIFFGWVPVNKHCALGMGIESH